MNAVIVRRYGGPEALEVADVPLPEPGAGQVRLAVRAATVNPVDLGTRAGALEEAGLMRKAPDRPVALGWDVAGTLPTGERVIGLRDLLTAPYGTQAEHTILDAAAIAPAPATWSDAEAATLPLNGLTALQALDRLGLDPGQTLLVTGAAGALGGFALQLARHRGLITVATARASDEAAVRALGAEHFVPATADLGQQVRALVPQGVDAAFDTAVLGTPALDAVRNRGAFVAVVAGGAPPALRGITVDNVWIAADGAQLARLAQLADDGVLTTRVAATLPLADVARAHERLAAGGLRGRLVLIP